MIAAKPSLPSLTAQHAFGREIQLKFCFFLFLGPLPAVFQDTGWQDF